jgi:hypothetical protein
MAQLFKSSFEIVNTISNSIVAFLKNSRNIFMDIIINGIKFNKTGQETVHYYYKYINIALIILVFGLVYYLNNKFDLFGIKNTKYEILASLVIFSIAIFYFLFMVFRNNNNKNIFKNDRLNPDNESIVKTLSSDGYFAKDYNITSTIFKQTYITPLGYLFMYIVILFVSLISILALLHYILYLQRNTNLFSITQTVIGLTILIVILAILAVLFSIKSTSKDETCKNDNPETSYFMYNYICILKKTIFFIPCLLVLAIDEINKDIKLTPNSIYLLLFILLLLITLLFLLPYLFKYVRTLNKSSLLQGSGPYYLNEMKVLGIYQNLNKNVDSTIDIPIVKKDDSISTSYIKNPIDALLKNLNLNKNENSIFKTFDSSLQIDAEESKEITKQTQENISDTKGYNFKLMKNDYNGIYNIKTSFYDPPKSKDAFPYNYSYSISFYIYINPQPTNTSVAYSKDTEIFNYAYKPVIYYNGKSQSIIIRSRTLNNKGDQLDTIYETKDIKFQKWIFFVINYDNNNIDIFIDGKLVGSKQNVTPFFKGDKVTIGEKEGIHGSIKEITYYSSIVSPLTIELLYNLTNNK